MSQKTSENSINMVKIEKTSNYMNAESSNLNLENLQTMEERFESFLDVDNLQEKNSEKKLTISKSLNRHYSDRKSGKLSTKNSISFEKSNCLDISKKKQEDFRLSLIREDEHKSETFPTQTNFEDDFLFLKKSDLTNKLLDILKQRVLGIPFFTILTIMDIALRTNIIIYFFYKLFWVSQYYYVYLTFLCVCRVAYILIMIKVLFQTEFDDVYIERIAANFKISNDEVKLKFWNKSVDYDFEFNLDPNKKKISPSKTKKSFDFKKAFKYIGLRLLIVLCPPEINFIVVKAIYEETYFSLLITIICSWFYKSVEIFTIIPFLCFLYFYENWQIGLNYDFISMILLFGDMCKTLITIIFLFFSNKRKTRSNTLFLLENKK